MAPHECRRPMQPLFFQSSSIARAWNQSRLYEWYVVPWQWPGNPGHDRGRLQCWDSVSQSLQQMHMKVINKKSQTLEHPVCFQIPTAGWQPRMTGGEFWRCISRCDVTSCPVKTQLRWSFMEPPLWNLSDGRWVNHCQNYRLTLPLCRVLHTIRAPVAAAAALRQGSVHGQHPSRQADRSTAMNVDLLWSLALVVLDCCPWWRRQILPLQLSEACRSTKSWRYPCWSCPDTVSRRSLMRPPHNHALGIPPHHLFVRASCANGRLLRHERPVLALSDQGKILTDGISLILGRENPLKLRTLKVPTP